MEIKRVESNRENRREKDIYIYKIRDVIAHTVGRNISPIIGGGKFGGQAEREAGVRAIYPISSGADGARLSSGPPM